MNERIKELYDKLGLDFKNFQRVTVTESDMQYFAELIVQECAEVGDSGDSLQDGGIARMIKQHFGVEE